MTNCCEDKSCEISAMRANHRRILWVVLAINAAMFLIEGVAGLLANSTSLLADALDMLGDALVYGFSLFALSRFRARRDGRLEPPWRKVHSCWP